MWVYRTTLRLRNSLEMALFQYCFRLHGWLCRPQSYVQRVWRHWAGTSPSSLSFFLKKVCRLKIWQMERCSLLYVIKRKLKQWDTTTHVSEWPQSWTMGNQILVRARSDSSTHPLPLAMRNSTATLWNSLAVPYKTEHTLTIQRAVTFFSIYLKGVESLCPHKNLHTYAYSSFIRNCQNLEAAKNIQ